MASKLVKTKVAPRLENKPSRIDGILMYDIDNLYCYRMTNLRNTSGAATFCVELFQRFMEGDGLKDNTFYKAVVNNKGLKMDKLHRKVTTDFADRNGFAIHVNYNALYQIIDVRAVPFADCRKPDEDCENPDTIIVYDDWSKTKRGSIKRDRFQTFDRFDPNPDVIDKQVAAAGGWANWPGQIFWYSEAGEDYPVAKYDPVIDDVETDGRIKVYRKRKAGNGFNADFFFLHPGLFEDDDEKDDFKKGLEDFQGDDRVGNVPLIEYDKPEEKPELLAVPKSSTDQDFCTNSESAVQTNIRKRYGFPPVLTGDFTPGKLGSNQEIIEATEYVNGMTNRERRIFEETYEAIFSLWYLPINPTNDYSILPLTIIKTAPVAAAPAAAST